MVEPWRVGAIVLLLAFIVYGIFSQFIDWATSPEEPNPPFNLEATFGRVVIRWLIRGLLVAVLALLIFAAGVVFRQGGFQAEGPLFDSLCTRLPGLCELVGLR